ncbi:MAG TPA: ATP-binding protein [Actinomycetaceae bacterium]|nr:ATP-binding protein [Actinomycetaceae bacterium]
MRSPFGSLIWRVVALAGAVSGFSALVVWLGTREGVFPGYILPLVFTASVLVAWAVARNAVEPLVQATKAAKAMASGDYSVRVEPQSRDEIGQLADAFNSMAQDLAEIDRFHRDTIANVSHELRTPIAALRSRLENMADGVEEACPENLEAAVVQVERLTNLLNYLLDLSRVDSGAAGLELVTIDVAELLDEATEVSMLAAQRRGTNLNFTSRIEPADLTLIGDRTRLVQVVTNVLDNATRHAPPDSTIAVEATVVRQTARIEIADTGPGVAAKDRERIFGRFQRAESGSAVRGGTGIGLAIARWAVSLHGGTIRVVDSDVGARFRIVLPLTGPPEPLKTKRHARRESHGRATPGI